MPSRCTRVLAPGLALALTLGACNDSRFPPAPACPGPEVAPPAPDETTPGAGSGTRPAAEIDPAGIAAAVAGLRFAVSERATLLAVAGARSAPLPVANVSRLGEVRWSSDRSQVDVHYEGDCGEPVQVTFSARTLVAHLEKTEARAAHRAGRAAEAAAGFARAVALDPDLDLALDLDLDLAYMDPASVLTAAGDVELALAVLEPLLSRNPVHVYARVMLDPALAALREHLTIKGLRRLTPGTAVIDDELMSLAWAPVIVGVDSEPRAEPRHIAAVHSRTLWHGDRYESILQIFDAATGEVRTELPLVAREDSRCDEPGTRDALALVAPCEVLPEARARVSARVEAVNRVLRDLGFMREFEAIEGTDHQLPDTTVSTIDDSHGAEFPADRLSLRLGFGKASVVRTEGAPARRSASAAPASVTRPPTRRREPASDQLLVERAVPYPGPTSPWAGLAWAQYLPEVDAVVYAWHWTSGQCTSGGPVVVLPLPQHVR